MAENENGASELYSDDDLDIEYKFINYDSDRSDSNWHDRADLYDNEYNLSEKIERKKSKGRSHTPVRRLVHDFQGSFSQDDDDSQRSPDETESEDMLRNNQSLDYIARPSIFSATPVRLSPLAVTFPNSTYQTPESSVYDVQPSKIPTYVNPFRRSANFKRSSSVNRSFIANPEPTPTYRNYQLLGDSQLLRFTEQVLHLRSSFSQGEDSRTRYHGYCVSGQKIKDLQDLLFKRQHKLSNKVIMLIGTNDFMQNNDHESMCASYSAIVQYLKDHTEHMVLLTVPPIPKFGKHPGHWPKLKRFNEYINNLASEDPGVTVLDLATAFVGYDNTTLNQYFEPYFEKNTERIDMIHLNFKGFSLLKSLLDIHVFNSSIN